MRQEWRRRAGRKRVLALPSHDSYGFLSMERECRDTGIFRNERHGWRFWCLGDYNHGLVFPEYLRTAPSV